MLLAVEVVLTTAVVEVAAVVVDIHLAAVAALTQGRAARHHETVQATGRSGSHCSTCSRKRA
jgi:ligand-binding sensor protein